MIDLVDKTNLYAPLILYAPKFVPMEGYWFIIETRAGHNPQPSWDKAPRPPKSVRRPQRYASKEAAYAACLILNNNHQRMLQRAAKGKTP